MNARTISIPILATLAILTAAASLHADEVLRRLPLDDLDILRDGPGRLVDDVERGQVLEIVSGQPSGLSLTLLEVDHPGITTRRYVLVGEVAYDEVEGQGYLEMWSAFADGSRYFSKTLGQGPLRPLAGSADWRPFSLPFDLLDSPRAPEALTLGLVLPGRGTVRLHGVELRQLESATAALPGRDDAWWSDRQAALIGGFGGAALGVLASLFAWLASRGRARRAVVAGVKAVIVLGALCLGAGIVAVALGQSYAVYYPLLLIGAIDLFVMPIRLRAMRQRYTDLELRRMRRQDLGTA